MKMAFYFGYQIQDFLFYNVNINTVGGFVGCVAVVVLLTLALDALRVARAHLDRRRLRPRRCQPGSTANLVAAAKPARRVPQLVAATALHVLSVALGYVMMLIVMLYNAYIFIAFILTVGLGYWLLTPYEARLKAAGLPPRRLCGKDNPAMCDPCCSGTGGGAANGTGTGSTSAAAPGTANGTAPGTANGTAPGTVNGTAPGTANGTATAPGTVNGTATAPAPAEEVVVVEVHH